MDSDFHKSRIELAHHMHDELKKDTSDDICMLKGSVKKIQRIGTKSVYGQVFKISEAHHKHHVAAAKVMYETKANIDEVKWYRKFQKLVENNTTPHFPLVYFARPCGTVCSFQKGDKAPKNKQAVSTCMVAVSELAAGDLRSWILEKKRSPMECMSMILQVCMALWVLHQHGVVHNDLHWGNVLYHDTKSLKDKWMDGYTVGPYNVQIRNKGALWILWDFGKMKKTANASYVISRDLYRILHFAQWAAHEKSKNVPPVIAKFCELCISIIKLDDNAPWEQVVQQVMSALTKDMEKLINRVVRVS